MEKEWQYTHRRRVNATNKFLSHEVDSYDNHAPISYRDNEPNTSVATPSSLYLHKFVYGPWSLSGGVKTVLRNRPIEQTLILGGNLCTNILKKNWEDRRPCKLDRQEYCLRISVMFWPGFWPRNWHVCRSGHYSIMRWEQWTVVAQEEFIIVDVSID